MLLKLEVGDTRPLYHQIASAVRRAVRDGSLAEGDRLPATRDLATSLDVNMHTVLKAYGILRDEGLIELRRGRGAVVVSTPADAEVDHLAKELVRAAREHGLDATQVIKKITEEFS